MIQIQCIAYNAFQENTYIIYDDEKNALVIDPGCYSASEKDNLRSYVLKENLKVKAIINTHGHIDHLLGVAHAKAAFNVPWLYHEDEKILIQNAANQGLIYGFALDTLPEADGYLKENQDIELGNYTIKVIHVPGHSKGHIALYSPEGRFVITGDVLFYNSIGRTDLPGGDYKTLIDSIKQKLLILPDETVVYPGHGPKTTIGYEKQTNMFIM